MLYFTPKWNGLEAAIGYSFDAEMQQGFATGDNDRVTTAGLRYSNGPLVVAATYEQLNPSNQTPDRRDAKNFQFGVAYDFEIIKLHAGYNEQRDINLNPAPGYVAAGNDRDRAYTFGVSVPVAAAASWPRTRTPCCPSRRASAWHTSTTCPSAPICT